MPTMYVPITPESIQLRSDVDYLLDSSYGVSQMKQDIAREFAEKLVALLDQKYGDRIDDAFLLDLKRMFEFE